MSQGLAERMTREAIAAGAVGDLELRTDLLDQALQAAPDHGPARWARGEMKVDGEWRSIDEIQSAAAGNELLAKYERLRGASSGTPDDHLQLGRWCSRQKLDEEARFHWLAVLNADRENREALAALDSVWLNDQLVSPAEAKAARVAARQARKIQNEWHRRIAGWERALSAGGDQAAQALTDIEAEVDESAIPEFEKLAAPRRGQGAAERERRRELCIAYITALQGLPSYEATVSLARLAVLAEDESIRTTATDVLQERPTYEILPVLITGLTPLVESRFEITRSEYGSLNYTHELEAETLDAVHIAETSTTVNTPVVVLSGTTMADVRRATRRAESRSQDAYARMMREAARLEQMAADLNASREQLNGRIVAVLEVLTGKEYGNEPTRWWDFWREHNGYDLNRDYVTYRTSQTYDVPVVTEVPPPSGGHECFAAGTLVWTKTGQQEIETLLPGDLVLTMDERTGELCFRPVLETTRRAPSPLLRIVAGGYQMLTTEGHPFWVEGRGWRMARELTAGDSILSAQGTPVTLRTVASSGEEQEAFNLVVEGNSNYFVGPEGLLAHDNSPRRPELTRVAR